MLKNYLIKNNIKIISNIGAANPMGAAKRILEIAKKQNTKKPTIGVVLGDDLLDYMSNDEILDSPTMEGLDFSNNKITAANVYLGAQPIAEALKNAPEQTLVVSDIYCNMIRPVQARLVDSYMALRQSSL